MRKGEGREEGEGAMDKAGEGRGHREKEGKITFIILSLSLLA